MAKKERSEDLAPFDYIGEDYAVSAFGYVLFGLKIDMREAYTMADSNESESSEVAGFYHGFKNALLKLDEGTIINKYTHVYTLNHKADKDSIPIGNKTRKWNERMFQKRDVVFSDNYMLVSIPFRNLSKKKAPLSPLTKRMSKFSGIENLSEFRNTFEGFVSNLSQVCESIEALSGDDILDLYVKIWNLGEGPKEGREELNPIQVNSTNLVIGDKYTTVLTSSRLPTVFDGFTKNQRSFVPSSKVKNNTQYKNDANLPVSYLFPLGIGLPTNHFLVETIRIEDADFIESKLSSEKLQLNFLRGLNDNSAIKKTEDIESFTKNRVEFGYKYASWGVSCVLYADSEEELRYLSNLVVNKASNELDLTLVIHNTNLFKTFYACLPGAASKNEYLRLSYLEVVAYLTHVESFKKGNANGIVLVDMFGKPYVFDFWDEENKYVEARNMMIFGPTGQGKSFTVNHLLDQCFWNGDVIFIIDVGGSYKRATNLNGGLYLDSKDQSNLRFNPFLDCYKSEGGSYMPQLDMNGKKDTIFVDFLATLLISCYGGLEVGAKGAADVLKKSIIGYYDYLNQNTEQRPCFDTYYAYFKTVFHKENPELSEYFNLKEFIFLMEKYTSAKEFGFLLNSEKTFDSVNRWICFDLVGLAGNDSLGKPTMLIVMNLFEKIMKLHFGNRVRMFIDEAVDFLKGSQMGDYIGGLYRKIRKQGGQVCIITQTLDYLDDLDPLVRSSILGNSEIKVLLNHLKAGHLFKQIQNDLSFSNSEMELLKNQTPADNSYRIGFMKFGTMKGFLFRMEISPQTYALYQTNAKEIELIDKLIDSTGNIDSAVESFVEEKFGVDNDELNA